MVLESDKPLERQDLVQVQVQVQVAASVDEVRMG
jgi:hypothetical protein